MLEDGDLLHVDRRGRAHVFNVAAMTAGALARGDMAGLEVERVGRKIEAELESVMKVCEVPAAPLCLVAVLLLCVVVCCCVFVCAGVVCCVLGVVCCVCVATQSAA